MGFDSAGPRRRIPYSVSTPQTLGIATDRPYLRAGPALPHAIASQPEVARRAGRAGWIGGRHLGGSAPQTPTTRDIARWPPARWPARRPGPPRTTPGCARR